jgi:hypothetical protein
MCLFLILFSSSFCFINIWKSFQRNTQKENYYEKKNNDFFKAISLLLSKKEYNEQKIEYMKKPASLKELPRFRQETVKTQKSPTSNVVCVNGIMNDGVCQCSEGYFGANCSSFCSENGSIVNNTYCRCNSLEYQGSSCDVHCYHGQVVDNECVCTEVFFEYLNPYIYLELSRKLLPGSLCSWYYRI